jgi:hypothetical protein
MQRYILILLLFISITSSCKVKKQITSTVDVVTEVESEKKTNITAIDISRPKSNIFVSDRISLDNNGLIIPISRSIKDPVTNQTLEFSVSDKGEVSIISVTQADTIRIEKTDIVEDTNTLTKSNTKSKETKDFKFDIGSIFGIVTSVILGVIPGGGIISTVVFIIIALILIMFIRRIFRKKNDTNNKT